MVLKGTFCKVGQLYMCLEGYDNGKANLPVREGWVEERRKDTRTFRSGLWQRAEENILEQDFDSMRKRDCELAHG